MDSSELPNLPSSLTLGSQIPASFNPHDTQPVPGFSPVVGPVRHGQQVASYVVSSSNHTIISYNLASRLVADSPKPQALVSDANGRYNVGVQSRVANEQTTKNTIAPTTGYMNLDNSVPQPGNNRGELEWVVAPLSSSRSNVQRHNQLGESDVPSMNSYGSHDSAGADGIIKSYLGDLKLVPNPPNLQAWRERLFNVDEPITLTQEQYASVYFFFLSSCFSLSCALTDISCNFVVPGFKFTSPTWTMCGRAGLRRRTSESLLFHIIGTVD